MSLGFLKRLRNGYKNKKNLLEGCNSKGMHPLIHPDAMFAWIVTNPVNAIVVLVKTIKLIFATTCFSVVRCKWIGNVIHLCCSFIRRWATKQTYFQDTCIKIPLIPLEKKNRSMYTCILVDNSIKKKVSEYIFYSIIGFNKYKVRIQTKYMFKGCNDHVWPICYRQPSEQYSYVFHNNVNPTNRMWEPNPKP